MKRIASIKPKAGLTALAVSLLTALAVSFIACQPEQLESSTTFTPFEYRIFVTNPS